ncbi:MAG: hypothetical protein ABIH70_03785 [Chloroflexota bacterium]
MVTREGFSQLVENAFAGMNLSAEASQVIYPVGMFVPSSDLTPLKDKMDELIAGLTRWQPKKTIKRVITPPRIKVEGKDYEEAVARMNNLFLRNMWSDGLSLTPPTEEKVDWVLTGTGLPRDKVVGKMLPRGGVATVETVAVNLAIAGGRPEYLPVLIATVEAICDPAMAHHRMNATTCSAYPVVIINGPIAQQIRLGSGYGCLGPDPLHPAGASIGRAIRLLLQGAGGAVPGIGTMSIFGGPARYTSIVFAEDEEGLPAGWKPLSAEQGFPAGSNTVTAYAVASTTNVPGGETGNKKITMASLNKAAGVMGVANGNYWLQPYNPEGAAGFLVMARGTAKGLSRFGWTKEKVKTYLWENSKIPASELEPRVNAWWLPDDDILEDPMPISVSPEGIKIVVAGGLQSGHMMWLQVGCCPEKPATVEIKLPKQWEKLLKKAEEDLGPLPTMLRVAKSS